MTQWRAVLGFDGLYEVSDAGEVRSLARVTNGAHYRGRVLQQETLRGGYRRVVLSKGGIRVRKAVHRLVAEAFVDRTGGDVVRHFDGDPANNSADNLRWGTPGENLRDKRRHGTDHQVNKDACPRGHRLVSPNLVEAERRRGHRECLVCAQARAIVHQREHRGWGRSSEPLNVMADRKYRELMDDRCAPASS